MRAGVQPGGAAPEQLDLQPAGLEVEAVEVRDLQFAALGRLQLARQGDDLRVVKIQAGNGVVRLGLDGLLLQREHAAVRGELDDAVALGVGHVITEDRGAAGPGAGGLEGVGQLVPVKKIVAEDQRGGRVADVVGPDQKGLGEAVRARLLGVRERQAELGAVAQQAAEEREVLRGGDEENLADAGEHQHRQRIIDHRLVVDRHELLAHGDGQGIEPGAGAAGEDDAFAGHGDVGWGGG